MEQPKEGLKALEDQAITRKASEFTVLRSIPQLSDIKLGMDATIFRELI